MTTSKRGEMVVVTIEGRLEAPQADELEAEFARLLEEGARHLMLDMAALDYISSAGLRALLVITQKVQQAGGKLLLSNLGGAVKEVFDISGLSSWSFQGGSWVPHQSDANDDAS